MNINDYLMNYYKDEWDNICKERQFIIEISDEGKIILKHNMPHDLKLSYEDLIYLTCLTNCYKNGPKSIQPTLEQCLVFENIEANINLNEYNQIFETVIIELPQEYRSTIQSQFNINPPISIIMHWRKDLNALLCSVFFGKKKPVVILFISPAYATHTIEESIIKSLALEKYSHDKDYLASSKILRLCINLNLYVVNFGHQKLGYANIKQHRFLERNKPLEAKKDIEYYSLKQNIKLYRKETYPRNEIEGTHASPKPHWRKGHLRHQHYGAKNELSKMIFIMPVFVCNEKFKGEFKDTQSTYRS